jgi:epoxyqueuosine reductase QueG
MTAASLTIGIKDEARRLGFDAVGISTVSAAVVPSAHALSSAESLPQTLFSKLQTWLARGYHATMAWMARDPTAAIVLMNGRVAVESPAMPGARTTMAYWQRS